jgi:hypothetical protein
LRVYAVALVLARLSNEIEPLVPDRPAHIRDENPIRPITRSALTEGFVQSFPCSGENIVLIVRAKVGGGELEAAKNWQSDRADMSV